MKKIFAGIFLLGVILMFVHSLFKATPKVAVIGAGLAGLTTGYRLKQAGFDVRVFEARKERVGGRVFSITMKVPVASAQDNEQQTEIAELGGQNISDGGKAEHMMALLDELKLEVIYKKREGRNVCYQDGALTYDSLPDVQRYGFTPESLAQRLKQLQIACRSMDGILQELFKDDLPLYNLLSSWLAGYEGSSPADLSSYCVDTLYGMLHTLGAFNHTFANGQNCYYYRCVKGGNSRLAECLAAFLSPHVYLGHQLIGVTKDAGHGYQLTFSSGVSYNADILVLAMPCSVYSDIEFSDTVMPRERLRAIQSVLYGTPAKIVVPIKSTPKGINGCFGNCMNSFIGCSTHVVTMYYLLDFGKFTHQTIERAYNQGISIVRTWCDVPASLPTPVMAGDKAFSLYEGPVGHSWPNDPFAKGAYSAVGVGQEEIFTTLTEYAGYTTKKLFEPIDGTLFFAGEHATILLDYGGTMEAAIESGERTAKMIKDVLLK